MSTKAKIKLNCILLAIKKKKDVLWGRFSNKLDHKCKEKAWGEVTTLAKSLGICKDSKDWKYVRDHIYGQWKLRSQVIMKMIYYIMILTLKPILA